MTQQPPHHDPPTPSELPDALGADLRSLYRAGEDVPTRVDDAVMAAARDRFATISDQSTPSRRSGLSVVVGRIALVGGPLAAAAILAFVVFITPWRPGQPQGPLPLPGTGRQQAQNMLEQRLDDEMIADELDFEKSRREGESIGFADARRDADVSGDAAAGFDAEGAAGASVAMLTEAAPAEEAATRGRRAAMPSRAAGKSAPLSPEDFDRDGVVDMRDALAMALILDKGPWSMGMEWDLNADGRVDSSDVEVVALAAVNLERHGEIIQ